MVTKLARIVTRSWKNPPSKSCDVLIMWSREKLNKTISALPEYLLPPNLPEIVTCPLKNPPSKSCDFFIMW